MFSALPKRGGVSGSTEEVWAEKEEGEARLQSAFFPSSSFPRTSEKTTDAGAEFKFCFFHFFFFFFLLHLVPTIILSLIQSAVAALYFIKMTKMVIGIFNQGKACYIHSTVPALGHTVLHIQVHMSDSFLCLKYVHGCITSCLTQQIKTLVIRICESSSV